VELDWLRGADQHEVRKEHVSVSEAMRGARRVPYLVGWHRVSNKLTYFRLNGFLRERERCLMAVKATIIVGLSYDRIRSGAYLSV
jgi:hypothetical protein